MHLVMIGIVGVSGRLHGPEPSIIASRLLENRWSSATHYKSLLTWNPALLDIAADARSLDWEFCYMRNVKRRCASFGLLGRLNCLFSCCGWPNPAVLFIS